ncbi:MAG: DUF3369 domain-containing protein [Candidatus Contendobacter sp.]|nr:DUF3369 domain-containing protein [Candidatus Contendobacter sp.]
MINELLDWDNADEPAEEYQPDDTPPWKLLVVDDDPEVHSVTRFVLQDLRIFDRPLRLLHAHSAQEARERLRQHPDIAVALVDVVMETDQAGLDLVEYIRDQLGLRECRIILRTGQPGYAPELTVIHQYDINDYRTKAELTHTRLITTVSAALRAYEQLRALAENRRGLELIIQATAQLMEQRAIASLAEDALIHLSALLGQPLLDGLVCAQRGSSPSDTERFDVVAAAGRYAPYVAQPLGALSDQRIAPAILNSVTHRQHIFGADHTVLYLKATPPQEAAIFLDSGQVLAARDRSLLEVFITHVAACLRNVNLVENLLRARREIERQRAFLRTVIDADPHFICVKNRHGQILLVNRGLAENFGLTPEQMVGRPFSGLITDPEWARASLDDDTAILTQARDRIEREVKFVDSTGRTRWLYTVNAPIKNEAGEVEQVIGVNTDITERKQAEAQLRESEARFRRLAENAPDMIYRLSLPEGRYEYVSPVCQQLTGHAPEEFYQSPHLIQRIIHPDWRARFAEEWAQLMVGQALPTFEYQIVHPSGPSKWLRQRNVLVRDDQGQPRAIEGIISDITEHKLLEEQIKTSLREKEALLKEIHHRVKNNLQLISSLLDLQAGYVEDQSVRNQLRESRNRVKSMALIHERLYQIPNLAQINLADYAHDLVTHLIHAYATPERAITARVAVPTGEPVLGVESAVPCGLIINELVTNALKHAFATRRAGEIVISLGVADGQRTLRVRDDGIGFPPTVDFRHTPSLGLAIVMTLVKQLKGSIELRTEAGTEFVVAFPNPAATKVAEQSATATRALDPRG